MPAQEEQKQEKERLLAEAKRDAAAREAARAEFEAEMAGATDKVRKLHAEEAAAASAADQVKEAKMIMMENAEKLGDMADTTDEMQQTAAEFAAGISALNAKQKKKGGGFLGGLLS